MRLRFAKEKLKRPTMGPTKLATLALLLSCMAGGVAAYTAANTADRFSDNSGNFDSEETYTDVNNNSETYRMQWELYEGSIALVQMALVWKEIST